MADEKVVKVRIDGAGAEAGAKTVADAVSSMTSATDKASASLDKTQSALTQAWTASKSASDSFNQTAQAANNLGGSSSSATAGLKSMSASLEKISLDLDNSLTKMRSFESKLKSMGSSVGSALGFLKDLIPVDLLMAGALAFYNVTNRLQGFLSTMSVVTGSVAESRKELSWLFGVADRWGVNITSITQSYAKLAAAAKGTTMEGKGVKDAFEAITIASSAMHLSAEDTRLVLYALQQMVSKGTVSFEELRRQMAERFPGAMQIAADSMGMSNEAFQKLVKSGQLFTADFLPKFSKGIVEAFGPATAFSVTTLNAAVNRLATAWESFLQKLVDSSATQSATDAVNAVTAALKDLSSLAPAIGDAFAIALKYATDFMKGLNPDDIRRFAESGIEAIKLLAEIFGLLMATIKLLLPTLKDVAGAFGNVAHAVTSENLSTWQKFVVVYNELLTLGHPDSDKLRTQTSAYIKYNEDLVKSDKMTLEASIAYMAEMKAIRENRQEVVVTDEDKAYAAREMKRFAPAQASARELEMLEKRLKGLRDENTALDQNRDTKLRNYNATERLAQMEQQRANWIAISNKVYDKSSNTYTRDIQEQIKAQEALKGNEADYLRTKKDARMEQKASNQEQNSSNRLLASASDHLRRAQAAYDDLSKTVDEKTTPSMLELAKVQDSIAFKNAPALVQADVKAQLEKAAALEQSVAAATKYKNELKEVSDSLSNLSSKQEKATAMSLANIQVMEQGGKSRSGSAVAETEYALSLDRTVKLLEDLEEKFPGATAAITAYALRTAEAADESKRLEESTKSTQAELARNTESLKDSTDALNEETFAIGHTKAELEQYRITNALAALDAMNLAIAVKTAGEGMTATTLLMIANRDALVKNIEAMKSNLEVRQVDDFKRAWVQATDAIANRFSQFTQTVIHDGWRRAFKDLWSDFLSWGLAAIAKLAMQKLVVSIFPQLAGQFTGAAGAFGTIPQLLGLGNSTDFVGGQGQGLPNVPGGATMFANNPFGSGFSVTGNSWGGTAANAPMGSAESSLYGGGGAGFGAGGSYTASGVMGGAAIGAGVGYFGNKLFGSERNQTGMTVGGTIGGMAGSYFGPLGSMAGAAIGTAIGSLFKKSSNKRELTFSSGEGSYQQGLSGSSAFGDYGVSSSKKIGAEETRSLAPFLEGIGKLDNAISKLVGTDLTKSITTLLSSQDITAKMGKKGTDIMASGGTDEIMRARYDVVLGAIDEDLAELLKSFKGTGEELANFVLGLVQLHDNLENMDLLAVFGENLDLDKLKELTPVGSDVVQTFNDLLSTFQLTNVAAEVTGKEINEAFGSVGLASKEAREELISMGGGTEQFSANMKAYVEGFLTNGEQLALVQSDVGESFEELNMAMPSSIEGFNDLVRGVDLTTESGRQLFATLMDIAPGFLKIANQISSIQSIIDDINGVPDSTRVMKGLTTSVDAFVRNAGSWAADLLENLGYEGFAKYLSTIDQDVDLPKYVEQGRGGLVQDVLLSYRDLQGSRDSEVVSIDRVVESSAGLAEAYDYTNDILSAQIRVLELQGKGEEALALSRKMELAALKDAPQELINLTLQIYELEDAATAAAKATEILNTKNGLMSRLYTAQGALYQANGDKAGYENARLQGLNLTRSIEIAQIEALDPALVELLTTIYDLEDATYAVTQSIQAEADAKAMLAAKNNTMIRMWQTSSGLLELMGDSTGSLAKANQALNLQRSIEIEALREIDPALVPLLEYIYALEDVSKRLSKAKDELMEAYERERDELQNSIDKHRENAKTLREYAQSLRPQTLEPSQQYASARDALATASPEKIPEMANAFLEAASRNATTAFEYKRDVARTIAIAESAAKAQDLLATIDEQQLNAMESQLEALGLINKNVVSFADALKKYLGIKDEAAELIANEPSYRSSAVPVEEDNAWNTAEYFRGLIDQWSTDSAATANFQAQFDQFVRANPGSWNADREAAYVGTQLDQVAKLMYMGFDETNSAVASLTENYGMPTDVNAFDPNTAFQAVIDTVIRVETSLGRSVDDMAAIMQRAEQVGGAAFSGMADTFVPQPHAMGGLASGWSMVGEEGPEVVNFGQAGQVYTAEQTAGMFAPNPEVATLLRQLITESRAANIAVAKNTGKTARILERFDGDGMPDTRTVV